MNDKETLEEAAERYVKSKTSHKTFQETHKRDFIEGAKWQQERSYSEEEVKKLAFDFYHYMCHNMDVSENLISENETNVDIWFEQFKKK